MPKTAANLLAIDTSTDRLALSLCCPHGHWFHESPGGSLASSSLLPQVQQLLSSAGLSPPMLDAVAFGRGPGAFTGLRTACSVAQGLALGGSGRVLPLDSLQIVAEDARMQISAVNPLKLWVAMDARMQEVYAAAYEWTGQDWSVTVAPALYTAVAWADQVQSMPTAWIAGNAVTAFGAEFPISGAQSINHECSRAQALGRLSVQAWTNGQDVDAAMALPIYLRDKVAQTTLEREGSRLDKVAKVAP